LKWTTLTSGIDICYGNRVSRKRARNADPLASKCFDLGLISNFVDCVAGLVMQNVVAPICAHALVHDWLSRPMPRIFAIIPRWDPLFAQNVSVTSPVKVFVDDWPSRAEAVHKGRESTEAAITNSNEDRIKGLRILSSFADGMIRLRKA
jgi:hypothetical protein